MSVIIFFGLIIWFSQHFVIGFGSIINFNFIVFYKFTWFVSFFVCGNEARLGNFSHDVGFWFYFHVFVQDTLHMVVTVSNSTTEKNSLNLQRKNQCCRFYLTIQ